MYVIYESEYDQEIPQSQTADQPMAPCGRATEYLQEQYIQKQSYLLSLPRKDDC